MQRHNSIIFLFIIIFSIGISFLIPQMQPNILIGIVGGLLVGLIAFFKIEYGIYILIFSMLLSPEIKLAEIPGRSVVIRIDDFILITVFFAWIVRLAIKKELGLLKNTQLNLPIILYIIICIAFTLKGIIIGDVKPVKSFFYVLKYIEYFILFFMVANVCKTEKDAKKYLIAALITCIIVVVYGYTQLGTGVRVSAPFEDIPGGGGGGEPATLGGYFILVLGIFLGIFLHSKNILTKIVSIGSFLLIIPPLFQTLSRASYMAFTVMIVTAIILTKRNKITLITMLIIVLLILPLVLPHNVVNRVLETFQGKEYQTGITTVKLDESSSARIGSWTTVLNEKLPKHFFTGYGITGVGFIDGQYFTVLGELGVIGFLSFIWILLRIFKIVWRLYRNAPDDFIKSISFGYLIAFIALLFHAITANTFIIVRVMEPFWFLTAIVVMFYQNLVIKEKPKEDPLIQKA